MNKAQKACIAESLTAILRKLEKCENRLDDAEINGDTIEIARLSARLESLSAELKGADAVLTMLGYVRKHHDDDRGGYYSIEKI